MQQIGYAEAATSKYTGLTFGLSSGVPATNGRISNIQDTRYVLQSGMEPKQMMKVWIILRLRHFEV